jgi:hypothetical protein
MRCLERWQARCLAVSVSEIPQAHLKLFCSMQDNSLAYQGTYLNLLQHTACLIVRQ